MPPLKALPNTQAANIGGYEEGEEEFSGVEDDSGNTPPPYIMDSDTELDIPELLMTSSEVVASRAVPASSKPRGHASEFEHAPTAPMLNFNASTPNSGTPVGSEGLAPTGAGSAPRTPTPVPRPSSVAALHDHLGLLGLPSMEGILDHVQGRRRHARLLERQLHEDPEAAGISPDYTVVLKAVPSTSGLQGPSHSLTGLTCRERSFLRPDSEGGAVGGAAPLLERWPRYLQGASGGGESQATPRAREAKHQG